MLNLHFTSLLWEQENRGLFSRLHLFRCSNISFQVVPHSSSARSKASACVKLMAFIVRVTAGSKVGYFTC